MHLEGRDGANYDNLIVQVWRCTPRLWWSEFRDTFGLPWLYELGGSNGPSFSIHFEAMIEGVWRCTWRPWAHEIGVGRGGSQSGGGSSWGRWDECWDSIDWLTRNWVNVGNCVQHGLPRDHRLAGSGRESILGWLNFVYLGNGISEYKKEIYATVQGKSSWQTETYENVGG